MVVVVSQLQGTGRTSRHGGPSSLGAFLGVAAVALVFLLLPCCHGWAPASSQERCAAGPPAVVVTARPAPAAAAGGTVFGGRSRRSTAVLAAASSSGDSDTDASGGGVQTIDLRSGRLDADHDVEGQQLADSIVRWLDAEWMPQEVHVRMAASAKASYVLCREGGKDDVMDIMMQISADLDGEWARYDKDAFVNAWDVGNYAADYLIKKSGNEGCACSSEIF